LEKYAVIDLGSNTFHLLIVERKELGFNELYRERVYTKLAKGGSNIILDDSFAKGIACLKSFRKKIDEFKVTSYRALGTAALRTASNGRDFISEALSTANIKIELIDGDEEAFLIAQGVQSAIHISSEPHLIMDIGGGSVEFILLSEGIIKWKQSFPIGLAILKAKFHQSEPISSEEMQTMQFFLDEQLLPLKKELDAIGTIKSLIGASGSFEVIQAILNLPRWNKHTFKFHVLDFFKVREKVMGKTHKERVDIPGLPLVQNQR